MEGSQSDSHTEIRTRSHHTQSERGIRDSITDNTHTQDEKSAKGVSF